MPSSGSIRTSINCHSMYTRYISNKRKNVEADWKLNHVNGPDHEMGNVVIVGEWVGQAEIIADQGYVLLVTDILRQ